MAKANVFAVRRNAAVNNQRHRIQENKANFVKISGHGYVPIISLLPMVQVIIRNKLLKMTCEGWSLVTAAIWLWKKVLFYGLKKLYIRRTVTFIPHYLQ